MRERERERALNDFFIVVDEDLPLVSTGSDPNISQHKTNNLFTATLKKQVRKQ